MLRVCVPSTTGIVCVFTSQIAASVRCGTESDPSLNDCSTTCLAFFFSSFLVWDEIDQTYEENITTY